MAPETAPSLFDSPASAPLSGAAPKINMKRKAPMQPDEPDVPDEDTEDPVPTQIERHPVSYSYQRDEYNRPIPSYARFKLDSTEAGAHVFRDHHSPQAMLELLTSDLAGFLATAEVKSVDELVRRSNALKSVHEFLQYVDQSNTPRGPVVWQAIKTIVNGAFASTGPEDEDRGENSSTPTGSA